jgi:hypothetical protein
MAFTRGEQITLPLAAAPLGGAPSVPQVPARGHAGWTVWIAVPRVGTSRFTLVQIIGPDARRMMNRGCKCKRTGERERRG